jgi:spore coat protein U-like protein
MKRPKNFAAPSLAALALLAFAPGAFAAADCSIFSSTLNFGNYDVLDPAPTDSTTNILIICTRDPPPNTETVSYTLTLSVGGGTYANRTMANGANTIGYNLYTSPAMTPATIWGNGTGGTSVVATSLQPLNAQNTVRLAFHTIYGRIPARQDVRVGTYTGSVVLTMNY